MLLAAGQAFILLPFLAMDGESPTGKGGGDMCMFGLSAICRATWKTRNKICFGKIHIRSVCEIIFYAIALMRYWAGIHPET
jgi:hypothetical protein